MDRQNYNVNFRGNSSSRSAMDERSRVSLEYSRPQTPEAEVAPSKKDNKFIIKAFDKIISFSIFMLFLGVPLYFTGTAIQGIIFEKQIYFYIWLLLGLVVFAAKGVTTGEMKIRRTPLDWPILGFWLSCGLATIFSVDRWVSFWGAYSDPSRGFMSVSAYIIAFYFIASSFNEKRLRLILAAIISAGAVLSIWTTLAMLGIKFLPSSIISFAPFSLTGSVTGLGIVFSSLIPIITVAVLKIAEAEHIKKSVRNALNISLLALLALDFFLILAFYNYVPWLGLFIGVVVFLVFILAKIMRPHTNWTWLPMVIFVIVMILRMTGAVSIAKVNLPVEVSLNYKTSYQIAVESLKQKFLLGSGPATYGYDFSLNRSQDFNQNAFYNLRFSQGTGIIAEAVPTIGAIGTFFLFLLILSYLGSQFYFLYRNKEKNKLYSLGLFAAALIIIVDVVSLRIDGAMITLAVLLSALALAMSMHESQIKENNLTLSLKASPKFALALAFMFMVVSAGVAFLFVYLGKIYASDVYAAKAAAQISQDPETALKASISAINYNPKETRYYTQLGQYTMALANDEASKDASARDVSKIQTYLNQAIEASLVSKNMAPNDVATVESLALIYENAALYVPESLALAEENYKRALELEPHNPVYFIKLGQLKIGMAPSKKTTEEKRQLVNEAKDLFQKAIDKKSNYDNGYYQLALAYEALEDLDKAIENGQKASQLANNKNANYLLALGRMYQTRDKEGDMKKAEAYYKEITTLNENDINGHFYLGLLHEKNNAKDAAKAAYNKVISIIEKAKSDNNAETINQLKKMIENVDRGIANTPESLGLTQPPAPPVPETTDANPPSNNTLVPEASQTPVGPELPEEPAE